MRGSTPAFVTVEDISMVATPEVQAETEYEDLSKKTTVMSTISLMFRKQPLASFGALIVIAMIIMAVFADVITSVDPEENNLDFMLTAPGEMFFLGTDQFG